MKETNKQWDENIETRLREAHQQVCFRPEWAEQLQSKISSELDRIRQLDPPITSLPTCNTRNLSSWQLIASMALALLLAAGGSTWLVHWLDQPESRLHPAIAIDFIDKRSSELPQVNSSNTSVSSSCAQNQNVESVRAAPGYLASKLMSDADFEIYLVLPTLNASHLAKSGESSCD